MRKLLIVLFAVIALSSCGTTNLYYWGDGKNINMANKSKYETCLYDFYNKQTPDSYCELICLYEDMTSRPGGSRGVVPPGICAEYGYLLLKDGGAEMFANNASKRQMKIMGNNISSDEFKEKAMEMFKKEIELYPESQTFIAPIIERLGGNQQ